MNNEIIENHQIRIVACFVDEFPNFNRCLKRSNEMSREYNHLYSYEIKMASAQNTNLNSIELKENRGIFRRLTFTYIYICFILRSRYARVAILIRKQTKRKFCKYVYTEPTRGRQLDNFTR